jgi:hypothetical protein
MKKEAIIIMLLCGALSAYADCFAANATVETKEIAAQTVDVLACKMLEVKGDMNIYVLSGICALFLLLLGVMAAALFSMVKKKK